MPVNGAFFSGDTSFFSLNGALHTIGKEKLTGTLRVSEDGELEGIDIHEHGAPAYHPESAYMGKGL